MVAWVGLAVVVVSVLAEVVGVERPVDGVVPASPVGAVVFTTIRVPAQLVGKANAMARVSRIKRLASLFIGRHPHFPVQ